MNSNFCLRLIIYLALANVVFVLEYHYSRSNPPFEPSFQQQMEEARSIAKLGHQIHLNREAAKNLKTGDIVRYKMPAPAYCNYKAQLYSVRARTYQNHRVIARLDHDQVLLNLDDDEAISPEHLQAIYKRGTDEWCCMAEQLVLEGLGSNLSSRYYNSHIVADKETQTGYHPAESTTSTTR